MGIRVRSPHLEFIMTVAVTVQTHIPMCMPHNVKERFKRKYTEQPRCVTVHMILHLKLTKEISINQNARE